MKKIILIIILAVIIIGIVFFFTSKMTENTIKSENPQVKLTTTKGEIILELYPEQAPITVENFLNYVKEGAYENTVFHRVIKDFMIQGGGFTTNGNQKQTKPPIKLESNNGLKNELGTIAMARTNVPDSATNQFFINTKENTFLNYAPGNPGYAVFGKVTQGMDIVKQIEASQTTVKNQMPDWPVEDVLITKAEVL